MKRLSVVPDIEKIIELKKNVMLEGPHGCGKSHTVRDLPERMGLEVAIFNCATMDPCLDFRGIPMPTEVLLADGTIVRDLEMNRPRIIDNCDVLFFDEVSRAQPETLNGILEIIEERSINGEKLPKLKSVFGAMNPLKSGDSTYTTIKLDDAFYDRWDHYFKITPEPDDEYLRSLFDAKVADALSRWWGEHSSKSKVYVSPRKLVKAGKNYVDYGSKEMLMSTFGNHAGIDITKLYDVLEVASGNKKAPEVDSKLSEGMDKSEVNGDTGDVKEVDPSAPNQASIGSAMTSQYPVSFKSAIVPTTSSPIVQLSTQLQDAVDVIIEEVSKAWDTLKKDAKFDHLAYADTLKDEVESNALNQMRLKQPNKMKARVINRRFDELAAYSRGGNLPPWSLVRSAALILTANRELYDSYKRKGYYYSVADHNLWKLWEGFKRADRERRGTSIISDETANIGEIHSIIDTGYTSAFNKYVNPQAGNP